MEQEFLNALFDGEGKNYDYCGDDGGNRPQICLEVGDFLTARKPNYVGLFVVDAPAPTLSVGDSVEFYVKAEFSVDYSDTQRLTIPMAKAVLQKALMGSALPHGFYMSNSPVEAISLQENPDSNDPHELEVELTLDGFFDGRAETPEEEGRLLRVYLNFWADIILAVKAKLESMVDNTALLTASLMPEGVHTLLWRDVPFGTDSGKDFFETILAGVKRHCVGVDAPTSITRNKHAVFVRGEDVSVSWDAGDNLFVAFGDNHALFLFLAGHGFVSAPLLFTKETNNVSSGVLLVGRLATEDEAISLHAGLTAVLHEYHYTMVVETETNWKDEYSYWLPDGNSPSLIWVYDKGSGVANVILFDTQLPDEVYDYLHRFGFAGAERLKFAAKYAMEFDMAVSGRALAINPPPEAPDKTQVGIARFGWLLKAALFSNGQPVKFNNYIDSVAFIPLTDCVNSDGEFVMPPLEDSDAAREKWVRAIYEFLQVQDDNYHIAKLD
ncbi:MAG: hypothetical protein D6712_07760 [Chloroflexi bacterium]|nr:MAG: hypothetical protein D6712_07760 [Chloroflexota bacterium]